MGSVHEEKSPTESPAKTNVRDLRNTELVSRLLAATPPYLYSALPLQPHAFFFSEMLRSFVNARHGCRPTHFHRRFKRRSYKYCAENDNDWRRDWKQDEEKKEPEIRPEVPLELTVDKQPRIGEMSPRRLSPKSEHIKSNESPGPPRQSSYVDVGTEDLPKPAPSTGRASETVMSQTSNLILPPPPPMWYPPLYNPQFGVDPLNFFIDLRVSGHIYDRKRALSDGIDHNVNAESRSDDSGPDKRLGREFAHRTRHVSAFSVPERSSTDQENKYLDRPSQGKLNSTSYVMKNLKRVYEKLHSDETKEKHTQNDEAKAESSDIDDELLN